ncbi:MAG: lipopolysaccharide assembly protein LapB [Lonepinella koalarum]|nr:lipopolysaccharide assembly protein LapB [Lonepinella koalarum]
MIELLFLLLPIAAAYGWYMGYRNAKKDQEEISNKLSRDYVAGMNLLLSNQTEKAVDLFLAMLEKQETENHIEQHSQFEAELTLGNLFRSRGEVDRALRIHQNLVRSPNYSFEQKLLAKQQLAKDFMSVGFYDRAENLYILLVDEPHFAENALQQLALIYQKTKEWKKAINVAEKLAKISPQTDNIALAQYYCELAKTLTDHQEKQKWLQQALDISPSCVRASLLLAELLVEKKEYEKAIILLENVLNQDPDYINEALPLLKQSYQCSFQSENFELFLIKAAKSHKNSAVDLALAELIAEKDSISAAQNKIYQQLSQNPSLFLFHRFIQYQIAEAEPGQAKESLMLLHKMVGERIKQAFKYRCIHCGYQSNKLIWNCPSCRHWQSVKPIRGTEDQ